jgi:ribosomal protein S6
MAKKVIESVQDERDANMYEFAFHLVPKMTEAEALESFADIKKLVEASGATIKNESAPALLNLAYQMEHTVESVKSKYNQVYFAWLILNATGIQILAITEELKHRTDIVRHLIITTKNDSPISSSEVAKSLSTEEDNVVTEDVVEEVIEEAEVAEAVTEEVSEDDKKVDDAIDKLVV